MKARRSVQFEPGNYARRDLYNVIPIRERGALSARGDRLQK